MLTSLHSVDIAFSFNLTDRAYTEACNCIKQQESQGDLMYQINDIVFHENGGVCRINNIGTPDFVTTGQLYYTLECLENPTTQVYVAFTHESDIRYIITKENAIQCLSGVRELQGQYNEDNKNRDREYAEVLKSGNFQKWFCMLKGILHEKYVRNAAGKQLNLKDSRYLEQVEKLIIQEFSIALDISAEDFKEKLETLV